MTTQTLATSAEVATLVARFLHDRGVDRIFGLCGGHVQPIWDRAARFGLRIVDVRDERAAVHMAHAHAELTGNIGVALVTAGPGFTNALTGIANAHLSRSPVLVVSGIPPRPQIGMGALQELPQVEMAKPVTRYACTVREPPHVLRELDTAMSRAMGGIGLDPGPSYIDFPTDVLREHLAPADLEIERMRPPAVPLLPAPPEAVSAAVDLLWSAERPLVISGRGARGAERTIAALLEALNAVYLDTAESRALLPDDHPAAVPAMRGVAMREADVVLTLGRRLDFQLGYGSAAVFPNARFVRVGTADSELRGNRRAVVEVQGSCALAVKAILEGAQGRTPRTDPAWSSNLRRRNQERRIQLRRELREARAGSDGAMHPYRLLGCVQAALTPDAVVIVDGGDILSFARLALSAGSYLDPGPLGCLGVGVPFGIAASLAYPERHVVVVTGDGSFGFNAIEMDTCLRHGARTVFIVANNAGWNIERYDQQVSWEKNVIGTELRAADYAAMARALGLYAEHVEDPAALPDAIARAFLHAPALLDVRVTRDAVSPDGRSGLASVPDRQPLGAWDEAERNRRSAQTSDGSG